MKAFSPTYLAHSRQNNTVADTVPSQSGNQSGSKPVQSLVIQMIPPRRPAATDPRLALAIKLPTYTPASIGSNTSNRIPDFMTCQMRGILTNTRAPPSTHHTCIHSSGWSMDRAIAQITLVCRAELSRLVKIIHPANAIFIDPFSFGHFESIVSLRLIVQHRDVSVPLG